MDKKLAFLKNWLGADSINLFGMPLTGKDTQGRRLAEIFNAELISGGHILRASKIPPNIRSAMEAGELIAVDDYIKLVLPVLSDAKYKNKPLILSAVGRRRGEEMGTIEAAEKAGHPIKAVVFLKMKNSAIKQRWEAARRNGDRGPRNDDNLEALRIRLAEYKEKTLPVIDFYRGRGLLVRVNGDLPPDNVTECVLDELYKFAKASYKARR